MNENLPQQLPPPPQMVFPFWKQVLVSVTVAVITSVVVEKILGRRR